MKDVAPVSEASRHSWLANIPRVAVYSTSSYLATSVEGHSRNRSAFYAKIKFFCKTRTEILEVQIIQSSLILRMIFFLVQGWGFQLDYSTSFGDVKNVLIFFDSIHG